MIVFILLLALILRVRGIHLLLPYFESGPDERLVIEPALNILKTGDWNPHFVMYGSFPIYWITLVYGLALGIRCWWSEGWGTVGECIRNFSLYDGGFLLFYLGRISSLIFGLATIYLVYIIGKKLFGRTAGLISAFLLSVSPLHIYFSQIFKMEISLVFWILLALYFSLKIFSGGTLKDYLGMGIASGLALGTKYNFMVLLPFLLVLCWSGIPAAKRVKMGFLTLYVALLVFIITCPYIFLDSKAFLENLEMFLSIPGAFIYGKVEKTLSLPLWLYRIIFLFPFFFSPLLLLAAAGGVIRFVRSDYRRAVIFLSFPAAFFVFSSFFSPYTIPQYQFPLLPFIALNGADMIAALIKKRSRLAKSVGWGILFLSSLFFLSDLKYPHLYGVYRSYLDAGEWARKEIPQDDRIVTCWWVYRPTGNLGFSREYNFKKAGDLSREGFDEINPDWAVLADSRIFSDPVYSRTLGPYGSLLEGLKGGEIKGYRLVAQFSPDPFWERWAGMLYQEYKGFRILIFRKAASE